MKQKPRKVESLKPKRYLKSCLKKLKKVYLRIRELHLFAKGGKGWLGLGLFCLTLVVVLTIVSLVNYRRVTALSAIAMPADAIVIKGTDDPDPKLPNKKIPDLKLYDDFVVIKSMEFAKSGNKLLVKYNLSGALPQNDSDIQFLRFQTMLDTDYYDAAGNVNPEQFGIILQTDFYGTEVGGLGNNITVDGTVEGGGLGNNSVVVSYPIDKIMLPADKKIVATVTATIKKAGSNAEIFQFMPSEIRNQNPDYFELIFLKS